MRAGESRRPAETAAGRRSGGGRKAAAPEPTDPSAPPLLQTQLTTLPFSYSLSFFLTRPSGLTDLCVKIPPAQPHIINQPISCQPFTPAPHHHNGDFSTPYADSSGTRPPSDVNCRHSPRHRWPVSASWDVRYPAPRRVKRRFLSSDGAADGERKTRYFHEFCGTTPVTWTPSTSS